MSGLTMHWHRRIPVIILITFFVCVGFIRIENLPIAESVRLEATARQEAMQEREAPTKAAILGGSLLKLLVMMVLPGVITAQVPRVVNAISRRET